MVHEEYLVPIAFAIALAIVLGLYFMFRYRTRAELQKTIRTALDKGQPLTPELVEHLGQPKRLPRDDLRRALVWMATGLGFAAFGLILGEEDAVRPLIAIGAFPFAIGLAYLIISRFSEKDASN